MTISFNELTWNFKIIGKKDYKLTYLELEKILIEQCGLDLSRGSAFGIEGRGFMRLNIGQKRDFKSSFRKNFCGFLHI